MSLTQIVFSLAVEIQMWYMFIYKSILFNFLRCVSRLKKPPKAFLFLVKIVFVTVSISFLTQANQKPIKISPVEFTSLHADIQRQKK